MPKEIVTAIMEFMLRVNLSGREVPAFNQCMLELNKLIDKKDQVDEPRT